MTSKSASKKSKARAKPRKAPRTNLTIRAHVTVRFDEVKRMMVVEPLSTPAEMRGVLKGKVREKSLTELLLAERRRDMEWESRKYPQIPK